MDGGLTWAANVPASPMFDVTIGWPGTPPQKKMGDYFHMISSDNDAALTYAATFNGEEDIYFVRLFPDTGPIVANGFEGGNASQWSSKAR